MDEDTKLNLIKLFKENEGQFAIIDYSTPNGIDTAKGKLVSISPEGYISVVHLKDSDISWGFKIEKVENYKFSPIKNNKGEDNE